MPKSEQKRFVGAGLMALAAKGVMVVKPAWLVAQGVRDARNYADRSFFVIFRL
jgi:hypothetical protein